MSLERPDNGLSLSVGQSAVSRSDDDLHALRLKVERIGHFVLQWLIWGDSKFGVPVRIQYAAAFNQGVSLGIVLYSRALI